MVRLTREQAAIIGAYTGTLAGRFQDLQEYAERKLGTPILTHEFGDKEMAEAVSKAAREDFLEICAE